MIEALPHNWSVEQINLTIGISAHLWRHSGQQYWRH
jgi:hypothetical protein